MKRALIAIIAIAACRGGDHHRDAAVVAHAGSGSSGSGSATWPELASFPLIEPDRVVALPTRQNTPRFDVGGPVALGGVAVVSSSQFGFVAVDYKTGQIAWTKPAGLHVAPPITRAGGSFLLIGECFAPPPVPAGRTLLGCARTITPAGTDQGYIAIHGDAKAVDAFSNEPGVQRVWSLGDREVMWRRGDLAVIVDPVSGIATPTAAADPPLVVSYKDRAWSITHGDDGRIVATEHGKPAWHTERGYTEVLGAVYLPEQSPMLRLSNAGRYRGHPELSLMDIDATGSMHGQVAFPVPGIALVAHAIDSIGDVALAVQLDASLDHHFIVGYAANSLLMWVYPLPRVQRADPIGLAVTPDAVLVFHDGDTLTVLPELSAPPTAPGAARAPLENSTP
ncbi:MAG TPA: hypothetical protein VH143_02345 [Kofleriaceae bacterium]|nr:hypothetical protein [Kofleriaceae bacterium]